MLTIAGAIVLAVVVLALIPIVVFILWYAAKGVVAIALAPFGVVIAIAEDAPKSFKRFRAQWENAHDGHSILKYRVGPIVLAVEVALLAYLLMWVLCTQ